MDLRDRFAAHFAAALVDAFTDAGQLARRAYDLAEAMLDERARRRDAAEAAQPAHHLALLDEPEPMLEPDPGFDDDVDPRWMDPPYDPSWDLEARWSAEPSPQASSPRPPSHDASYRPVPGPGLARTQPEDEAAHPKERSA